MPFEPGHIPEGLVHRARNGPDMADLSGKPVNPVPIPDGKLLLGNDLEEVPHRQRTDDHRRLDHLGGPDMGRKQPFSDLEFHTPGCSPFDDDIVHRYAQHLGRHLRQDRVGAGTQVGGTDKEIEGAVIVHLDGRRSHVQAGDTAAVQHHCHADTTSNVASRPLFCSLCARPSASPLLLPSHRLQPHLDTLIQATRSNDLLEALTSLAQGFGQQALTLSAVQVGRGRRGVPMVRRGGSQGLEVFPPRRQGPK